jgi:hypothetical protein
MNTLMNLHTATAKSLIPAAGTPRCLQGIPRIFNELEEFSIAIRTVGMALQVGVLDVQAPKGAR